MQVKRRQMIEERAQAIDKENMRLLGRLHAIDRVGGPDPPQRGPGFPPLPLGLSQEG